MARKLCLSSKDKKIAGVCGGIAEHYGLDSTLVRVIWVLLAFIVQGLPLIAYIVCWAVMPKDLYN